MVRKETPAACKEAVTEKSWNVTGYAGKHAQLRLIDHDSGGCGHIILITYKLAINLFQIRILEFSWSSF